MYKYVIYRLKNYKHKSLGSISKPLGFINSHLFSFFLFFFFMDHHYHSTCIQGMCKLLTVTLTEGGFRGW